MYDCFTVSDRWNYIYMFGSCLCSCKPLYLEKKTEPIKIAALEIATGSGAVVLLSVWRPKRNGERISALHFKFPQYKIPTPNGVGILWRSERDLLRFRYAKTMVGTSVCTGSSNMPPAYCIYGLQIPLPQIPMPNSKHHPIGWCLLFGGVRGI